MVKVTGADKHKRRLRAMRSQAARDLVYRALYAAGNMIEVEAEISITAGSVSGKGHVPSAPGEPPNADTRLLDGSIETTGQRRAMRVYVTSNAPYSAALEFGTSKMVERPFMQPAADKKRDAAVTLVRQAIQRSTKLGG